MEVCGLRRGPRDGLVLPVDRSTRSGSRGQLLAGRKGYAVPPPFPLLHEGDSARLAVRLGSVYPKGGATPMGGPLRHRARDRTGRTVQGDSMVLLPGFVCYCVPDRRGDGANQHDAIRACAPNADQ